ncbi:MAG: GGDEF domain-containing phosphodiesterase [Chromatiales bacterium]|nr:GGDEF domain-containing phosphodiesterase [Chromatiales bacterium]
MYIGGSIGISLYPDDGDNAAQLIRNADAAMYQAKNQGRNTYRFYTQSLTNAANRAAVHGNQTSGARWNAESSSSTINHRFAPATGAIIAVEALLRWQHPDLGLLSPAEFIPLAEETGLIVPLGAWVLEAACAQIKQWQASGLDHLGLAVNISTRQFSQPNLSGQIADILQRQQFDPTRLELEVTESAMMCPLCDAEATFRALKNLGITHRHRRFRYRLFLVGVFAPLSRSTP